VAAAARVGGCVSNLHGQRSARSWPFDHLRPTGYRRRFRFVCLERERQPAAQGSGGLHQVQRAAVGAKEWAIALRQQVTDI